MGNCLVYKTVTKNIDIYINEIAFIKTHEKMTSIFGYCFNNKFIRISNTFIWIKYQKYV